MMPSLDVMLEALSPHDLAELDRLLGARATRSFREYVDAVRPGYRWYRHNVVLADALQRVADGDLTRLMVFMPPRHGKSEEVSRLFPGYYLERHPDRRVALASYGANLAYGLSRKAKQFYQDAGNLVARDQRRVQEWDTAGNGGMAATGVRGPLTGKGFHLGIIDDPVKDAEDASSTTIQERNRDWYDSTFSTRVDAPDAAIVVIQTRWHEADLSGYILSQETDEPERWHVIDFKAIAEPDDEPFYPDTCTLETDWRDDGDALCPERYDLDYLHKQRAKSSYYFAALYQQRPRPREGGMFKREWFEIVPHAPAHSPHKTTVVRYWDRAASEESGDYTIGLKMLRKDGVFYILDVVRGQWSTGTRDAIMRQTAEADGTICHQRTEQEPGSAGKDAVRAFGRLMEGFPCGSALNSGDKVIRAEPVAGAAESGLIKLVAGPWINAFLAEVTAFDKGTHDDQVDSLSGAYNWLARRAVQDVPIASLHVVNPWKVQ